MKPLCDHDAIVQAVQLIVPPGAVTELRALKANTDGYRWRQTLTGYFDDPHKLADAAMTIRVAKGIYITPNEVDPALLCRAANHLSHEKDTPSTSDHHILRRRWFLLDVDCERPAGISATAEEVEAAARRARQVHSYLHTRGWPKPLVARSGNGSHLMYRIDLPADDDGLVQRCLEALSQHFASDGVKVDTSVFNPARIWKLYGTLACKGDDTPERPHRMSEVRYHPETFEVVSFEALEALAAEYAEPEPEHKGISSFGASFDLEGFIARHHLPVGEPRPWKGGGQRWAFQGECPMCEHASDGPFLARQPNGAIVAGCHHESCSWTWHDLRARLEPQPPAPPPASAPAAPAAEKKSDQSKQVHLREAANDYLQASVSRESLVDLGGIVELNHAIGGGVERGEMVIVAAMPGHGKSAFAMQCLHVAARNKMPGLIVSEEMSALAIGKRTLQYVSPVPVDAWGRDMELVQSQLDDHFSGMAPIHVVEACRTADAVEREVATAVRQRGVSVVAVDYVQLLASTQEKRYQAVSNASTSLRRIASRYNVLLLALTQLNRDLSKREKCVPRLSDLRDSGQLEQDADVVMFLVRPYQMDSTCDPALLHVFVAKNRNREIVRSAVDVRFEGARQRFATDLPDNYEPAFADWDPNDEGVVL